MEKFEEIKALIEACNEDVDKFYVKGNKAAAVRIRKTMQDIKNLAQEVRIHVQETKNSLKYKYRSPKKRLPSRRSFFVLKISLALLKHLFILSI